MAAPVARVVPVVRKPVRVPRAPVATAAMPAPAVSVAMAPRVRPGLAPTVARAVPAVMQAPWVPEVRRVPGTVEVPVMTVLVPTAAMVATAEPA